MKQRYFSYVFVVLKCLLYSYHEQHSRIGCTCHDAVTMHKIIVSQWYTHRSIFVAMHRFSISHLCTCSIASTSQNVFHLIFVDRHKFSISHRCTCSVASTLQKRFTKYANVRYSLSGTSSALLKPTNPAIQLYIPTSPSLHAKMVVYKFDYIIVLALHYNMLFFWKNNNSNLSQN